MNDLDKVDFDLIGPDGKLVFQSVHMSIIQHYAERYRLDGNKRKPTTLLKENGYKLLVAEVYEDRRW